MSVDQRIKDLMLISWESEGLNLVSCPVCGALIPTNLVYIHAKFHAELELQVAVPSILNL